MKILERMEYPGRLIIMGKLSGGSDAVLYAQTGRSPASQARRLVRTGDEVFVEPTDREVLNQGDPQLLVYRALLCNEKGAAVSNGRQTDDIFSALDKDKPPEEILASALKDWSFEPDEPVYTPRISGCLIHSSSGSLYCLNILKRAGNGTCERHFFNLPEKKGKGYLLSTYRGDNINPLPSFSGEPQEVSLEFQAAEEGAEILYKILGPAPGEKDFRVAAMCAVFGGGKLISIALRNRIN